MLPPITSACTSLAAPKGGRAQAATAAKTPKITEKAAIRAIFTMKKKLSKAVFEAFDGQNRLRQLGNRVFLTFGWNFRRKNKSKMVDTFFCLFVC
jgi:hypothetical protein